MTKPEVVDWLLNNGFGCGDKRKIHFYRSYRESDFVFRGERKTLRTPRRVEEFVDIWKGSVWYSDTGEEGTFDECGLDYVHIDEKGWLILENVWELKPKEEIR
jgi:hypothetical protein